MSKRSLSGRGLVSVLTLTSFLVLAFTGCILFVTPPGRVANWTGWTMLGLTKHEWGGLHILFALLFLVMSALHIWLNWQPLLGYFKSRLTRKFAFRWEWALSLLVCAVFFLGTKYDIAPFSSVIALNERAKDSWEDPRENPPMPHTELLSLSELSAKHGIAVEVLLERLKAKDVEPKSEETTLEDLSEEYGIPANELYAIILPTECSEQDQVGSRQRASGAGKGGQAGGGGGGAGGGYGRMTLTEYCENRGAPLEEVSAQLRKDGFDPVPTQTLRSIAAQQGMQPFDLSIMAR